MAKAIYGVSGLVGGKAGAVIRGVTMIAAGIGSGQPGLVFAGISSITTAFTTPIGSANKSRLNLSFDPLAPRKMALGTTALGTDVIYL